LSGLTLYFTERKARLSPNGTFFSLKPLRPICSPESHLRKGKSPHTSGLTLSSNNPRNHNEMQTSYISLATTKTCFPYFLNVYTAMPSFFEYIDIERENYDEKKVDKYAGYNTF
jgi:hypothetical protein